MKYTYIPYLQFRNSCIVRYFQPDQRKPRSENQFKFDKEEKPAYSGAVSAGARKRISKAITLLIQSTPEKKILNPVTMRHQKFKLSFITLTISETGTNYTAKEAYKMLLEPFLRVCRNKFGMQSYVWKAELQKRGQIHYHITSDAFIPHSKVREEWNNLQRKNGLLVEFKAKFGHENPNSTDIHSVYKIKNLEAYLVKYLCKVEKEKGATVGKVWDCSLNLKKYSYFTEVEDSFYWQELQKLEKEKVIFKKSVENCEILFFKDSNPLNIVSGTGKDRLQEFLKAVKGQRQRESLVLS